MTGALQYRVYLRGELRKLRNVADGQHLIDQGGAEALSAVGLGPSAGEMAAHLATGKTVDEFVESLTAGQARGLADACSTARGNDVRLNLAVGTRWRLHWEATSSMLVQQAESEPPELPELFRRHGYQLDFIAADPELFRFAPYSRWPKRGQVEFPVLLALPRTDGPGVRLFDGIHRAIRLRVNGATSIEVCAPTKPPKRRAAEVNSL